MLDRLLSAVIAVGLAVLAWLYTGSRDPITSALPQEHHTLTVPVRFLCPANFALRPKFPDAAPYGNVTLRLSGPPGDQTPPVRAYIDLTQSRFESGAFREPVHLQLPKDYRLEQEPPGPMAFELLSATLVQGQP